MSEKKKATVTVVLSQTNENKGCDCDDNYAIDYQFATDGDISLGGLAMILATLEHAKNDVRERFSESCQQWFVEDNGEEEDKDGNEEEEYY